jgi:hypothetical protein
MMTTTAANEIRIWNKYRHILTTRQGCSAMVKMLRTKSCRRLVVAYADGRWSRIKKALRAIRAEHGPEVAEHFG